MTSGEDKREKITNQVNNWNGGHRTKTTIMLHFDHATYDKNQVDLIHYNYQKRIELQIWDTTRQERFRTIPSYCYICIISLSSLWWKPVILTYVVYCSIVPWSNGNLGCV
ncbi:hypothetical protein YC2023_018404 [Brassica napus]